MQTHQLCAVGGLLVLLLGGPVVGLTQPASEEIRQLRQELEALKAGQQAIRDGLQEIKKLLAARGENRAPIRDINVTLTVADGFITGSQQAALTLVEFTDYQCPFCSRHVRETFTKLEQDYVDTGKLKYVVRDFPLETIHKFARKAAEAFWCANDQGKGREMHARLFAHQQQLQPEVLAQHAAALQLDVPAFQACLERGTYTEKITASQREGQRAGVTGTPAFFLGYTQADGAEVKAVTFLSGALPFETFKVHIDKLLEAHK